MTDNQLDALKKAAQAASPQNLDTAQEIMRYDDGSHMECPNCGGEGNVELNADFCNYDGHALGVQFYGIGPEHLAAEAYFRAASPATILALIERVEKAESAWIMVCGDWKDETVAIHGPSGYIASGLTIERAKSIIAAHGGKDQVACASKEPT